MLTVAWQSPDPLGSKVISKDVDSLLANDVIDGWVETVMSDELVQPFVVGIVTAYGEPERLNSASPVFSIKKV